MDFSQENPTTEQVKEWDADKLFQWIQQYRPNLLKGDKIDKFKEAEISGLAFLMLADNVGFFKNDCNLPAGPSLELARLARELAGRETAGISFMSCTPLRQQANNVTGNRPQAEDEMSNAADMKSKLLSFIPCTPRRQQANSVTGNRQQAGDAEMSDFDARVLLRIVDFMRKETTGTKSKLLSFMPRTPHSAS